MGFQEARIGREARARIQRIADKYHYIPNLWQNLWLQEKKLSSEAK
jgi:hypothetical protein